MPQNIKATLEFNGNLSIFATEGETIKFQNIIQLFYRK